MPQTHGRIFDDLARLANDAAGMAQGVRREAETMFKTQAERLLSTMDVVTREEFEAVKDMAAKARAENDRLMARIVALENLVRANQPQDKSPQAKSASDKSSS